MKKRNYIWLDNWISGRWNAQISETGGFRKTAKLAIGIVAWNTVIAAALDV
jgi:hypothetical protein